jgi:hypothetical protein
MCPRCGVYTWSGGLISQWIDHMTCEVSWAYNLRVGVKPQSLTTVIMFGLLDFSPCREGHYAIYYFTGILGYSRDNS